MCTLDVTCRSCPFEYFVWRGQNGNWGLLPKYWTNSNSNSYFGSLLYWAGAPSTFWGCWFYSQLQQYPSTLKLLLSYDMLDPYVSSSAITPAVERCPQPSIAMDMDGWSSFLVDQNRSRLSKPYCSISLSPSCISRVVLQWWRRWIAMVGGPRRSPPLLFSFFSRPPSIASHQARSEGRPWHPGREMVAPS
jgi:hypothetical protein